MNNDMQNSTVDTQQVNATPAAVPLSKAATKQKDHRIRRLLLSEIAKVLVAMGLVSVLAIGGLFLTSNYTQRLYDGPYELSTDISAFENHLSDFKEIITRLSYTTSPTEVQALSNQITPLGGLIEESIAKMAESVSDIPELQQAVDVIASDTASAKAFVVDNFLTALTDFLSTGDPALLASVQQLEKKSVSPMIDDIIAKSDVLNEDAMVYAGDFANRSRILLLAILGVVAVAIIFVAFLIKSVSRSLTEAIGGPMHLIIGANQALAKGQVHQVIDYHIDGDMHDIAITTRAIDAAICSLLDELQTVNAQIGEGNLHYRGDATKFEGAFADLIVGLNSTLDTFVKPLTIAIDYFNQISSGDIPEHIDVSFAGEFTEVKDSITTLADAMRTVESEQRRTNEITSYMQQEIKDTVTRLQKMAKGDLDIDPSIHPSNEVTQDVAEDFRVLNENLATCVKAIGNLIEDANGLAEDAVNGELSARADVTRHNGDYALVIKGFNHTLDAVISPINEAIAVLTELSHGNLSKKMVGDYKGDHALIKDTLNFVMDGLSKIIEDISTGLGEIADGNLTVVPQVEYPGDYAEIRTAAGVITTKLSDVMRNLNEASEQVANGSKQISDAAQMLANGSTEQASSIEELLASITQIATQTRQNAKDAGEANNLALNTKKSAEAGNVHMQDMLTSMSDINESSVNISKIIKVIDDIAFQTNILALNAAVEAARAGVHGKGFAVVAEEVRNLAAKSADAAKETTELIEGSMANVEKGSKIANATAKAFGDILEEVDKVADLVGSIATASSEQAEGIEQVNKGIEQVSDVVQSNSATAEQSAASSEELYGQSDMLKKMVAAFRISGSSHSAPAALPKASMQTISLDDDMPNISLMDVEPSDKY